MGVFLLFGLFFFDFLRMLSILANRVQLFNFLQLNFTFCCLSRLFAQLFGLYGGLTDLFNNIFFF